MMELNRGTSRVRRPVRLLTIAWVVTAGVLVWLGWSAYDSYHVAKSTSERNVRIERLRACIIHLDEVLTMSARMAAVTGDLRWEERYQGFEPTLDDAIKEARAVAPEAYSGEAAAQTDAANIALVEMEHRAFDLVRQGRLEEARRILFSDQYEKQKRVYAQGMTRFAVTRHLGIRLEELRGIIIHLDEVLTMSSRMAAATGDLSWEKRYRQFEPQLDAAIKEAIQLAPESYGAEAAAQTDAANIALVDMENQTFDLVRAGRLEKAQAALFSDEYQKQKRIYAEGMEQFDAHLKDTAGAMLRSEARKASLLIAAMFAVILILVAGWVLTLRVLRTWQADISGANHQLAQQATELSELTLTLDQKVGERTKELEASQIAALNMMEDAEQARAAAVQAEEMLRDGNAMVCDALKREKIAVSELETAMEQLEAAKEVTEAATRAKSEFLANMSHEIRTPMTAILGFADVLLEHGNLDQAPPERIEAAKTIKRNGEYLLAIINDILDLSKVEAGKMHMEHIACQPCRIVAEVASLVKPNADSKGLSFGIECIGAVPETIHSDPTRLRQILINLIGNAIKFTEVGGVRLITRFVERPSRPVMQFDVVDTGVGMTEEQVSRLFQPFTQADATTTRQFGGTGLGLTISKRFAEMLGGDVVVVDSQEGVGTRFRATVATGPLDGVKMLDDPTSAALVVSESTATRAPRDLPGLTGCRILLAEDGPDNQRLIAHVLNKAGAEVTVKENGKLAAEAALAAREQGRPFEVILMDMQMPVMDGYEATGLLRRKSYVGLIIALTAHAMEGDRQKCIQAGCDDYATKPIDRAKLTGMIHKHLHAEAALANA